jgi:hypothetical protein
MCCVIFLTQAKEWTSATLKTTAAAIEARKAMARISMVFSGGWVAMGPL